MQTKENEMELDRKGGILLKTAGEINGQTGQAGTANIIYHQEGIVRQSNHYLGEHITKIVAEYISLIIGLRELKRAFRCTRNKIIIINIKSHLVVN